jgi:hypothetical protein
MNKVIFFHIPKSAGSSFSDLLTRNYGPRVFSPIHREEEYGTNELMRSFDNIKFFRIARGHEMKCSKIELPEDFKGITFIRNPVDRLVSHYVHQFTGNQPIYKLDFEVWLNRFNRANYSTRWLGDGTVESAIDFLKRDNVVPGIVERYEESLRLISYEVFPDLKTGGKKVKMVKRSSEVFDAAKNYLLDNPALIKKHLSKDIEVYNVLNNEIFPSKLEKVPDNWEMNTKSPKCARLNRLSYLLINNIYKRFG